MDKKKNLFGKWNHQAVSLRGLRMVTAGRTLLILRGQDSGAPEKPEIYHGGFDDNHETDLLAWDSWPLGKIRNLVIFLVKKDSHLPLKIPEEFKLLFTQKQSFCLPDQSSV